MIRYWQQLGSLDHREDTPITIRMRTAYFVFDAIMQFVLQLLECSWRQGISRKRTESFSAVELKPRIVEVLSDVVVSVQIGHRRNDALQMITIGIQQASDISHFAISDCRRRAGELWPGWKATTKSRCIPARLGVLINNSQWRDCLKNRKVQTIKVRAQIDV